MRTTTLLRRSLLHYWRTNLAVLLGVVAATAVIGGALLVGDSVRDSLQQMSLDRLGGVDHALVGQRFFRQQLADELLIDLSRAGQEAADHTPGEILERSKSELEPLPDGASSKPQLSIAPAIVLQGTVVHKADNDVSRAAGVAIYGTDERLWEIWLSSRNSIVLDRFQTGDEIVNAVSKLTLDTLTDLFAEVYSPGATSVILNRRLADAIGVTDGDDISLLLEVPTAIPRDALLGDRNETVTELPLTVAFIAEDEATAGRFGLNPAQQLPLNAFVNLETLQRQLGMQHVPATPRNPVEKPGRVNALFVDAADDQDGFFVADELTESLSEHLTPPDLSLRLISHHEQGYVSLESEQMILEDAVGEAASEVAEELGLVTSPVLVYLLDEIASPADAETFSLYSVVAGIEFEQPAPFGPLEFVAGGPPTQPGEVVINEWLAEDLGIENTGESISVTHKVVGDRGELPDVERTWTVSGILKLDGPVADPHYTPYVEGITDADDFGDWRQPYPMELDRVTDRDDEYWDEHSTTPKLFLTLEQAQHLFASRYGKLTSFRFDLPHEELFTVTGPYTVGMASGSVISPFSLVGLSRIAHGIEAALRHEMAAEFEENLLAKLTTGTTPASGMVFQPVKEQGLAAAAGTTDFTGLFIGFSFFLIAAALLLIGLLFRLGIERRVSEYGLLSAVGLTPRDVRRLFLCEVSLVAVLGGLLGCAAAVGYAGLMVYGLKTWWFGAIGTKFLFLSVQPTSLVVGFVIAVTMSILTAWWTLWRMREVSTRLMLTGVTEAPLQVSDQQARGRRSRTVAMACGGIALLLLLATLSGLVPASEAFGGFNWRVVSFFVIGMSSLVGSLSLLSWQLDAGETTGTVRLNLSSVVSLGFRNAARHRGRSVLTASLIASATFVIVAVAAGRRNPAVEEPVNKSGNGGFMLLAEASSPELLLYDLNTRQGRADAGFDLDEETAPLIEAMRVMPFRVRPGEDASCLNLYQTRMPTILGIPDDVLQAMIDEDRFRFADTPGTNRGRCCGNNGLMDRFRFWGI